MGDIYNIMEVSIFSLILLAASNNSPADAKRMNHHGHKDRDQRERDHRSEVSRVAFFKKT